MKLCLCLVLCLLAHVVCADNIDVSQKGDFIVVKQEAGGSFVLTSAIRISHISSVTLDKVESGYRITIVTSPLSETGGATQKQYELKADRQSIERAFDQILALLERNQSN